MSSAPTPDEIWKDARWLAQAVDPRAGLVRLVEMTPETIATRASSTTGCSSSSALSHLLPWEEVAGAMPADARRDARWIFHIGHVGSTLIARLLGELDSVLSVREPRALRDLTFFPPDVRGRFVPTVAGTVFANLRRRSGVARQGDQLRQRDRGGACAGGRPGAVPLRYAAQLHFRHPGRARIRGRSWPGWRHASASALRRAACACPRRAPKPTSPRPPGPAR